MTEGIRNNVPFGVRNEEFEKVGAGSADRFAGDNGLLNLVARAAKLVERARNGNASPEQLQRAETLFQARVERLFDEYEGDARAIAAVTGFKLPGLPLLSYNSLHISVRNSDYVPPTATTTYHEDGSVSTRWDWSHASHTREYTDVTREQVLADPQLGTQLVMHNDFHL